MHDFRIPVVTTNDATTPAVSIRGLTKRYGKLTAVSKLDLEACPGEILGFLGLNGAGKTTTIRILLDLLRPTEGNASILGYDCQKQSLQARSVVGYLPGELGVYLDLTGREVLNLLARLCSHTLNEKYRNELRERFEFPDKDLRRKLREYSTGMKRKLGLLQALESDPPLLILDEPTEGLDPITQESFYELLSDLKNRGRTVFMSSHVLSEVARVCDRIALLRAGQLALLSSVDEIRKLAPRRVRVLFSEDVELNDSLPTGYQMIEVKPRVWTLAVEGTLGGLLKFLAPLPVQDFELEEPRLEDVLIKYYRDDAR
jgi:ABC-2 type transport system ATP-binding protein